MPGLKRIYNILRYGIGENAGKRKRAAKDRARQLKFSSERWQRDEEFAKRRYGSYEEYLEHQSSKLGKIAGRLQETEAKELTAFQRRFQNCAALTGARSVLCLGARLGTEVRALHTLGYFAVGIDLNPGENNTYVLPGDFHHMVFADASIDAIYCNALDHVFDLDKVLAEIVRLLRPEGIFIADLMPGYEEGVVPGDYEATYWNKAEEFAAEIARRSGLTMLETGRDQGTHRRDQWYQVEFRKHTA